MEKHVLPRIILTFMLCMLSISLLAQKEYYVFMAEGNPLLNNITPAIKGALVGTESVLELNSGDSMLLVDKEGSLYELVDSKLYKHSEIINYIKETEEESFIGKYLLFVYKEIFNLNKKRDNVGVVFRDNPNANLLFPQDSLTIYTPEMLFKWEDKNISKMNYFFLRNESTNHITKLGVNGNSILLYVDHSILKPDIEYSWGVSKVPFPDMDEIKFNSFYLLGKDSFKTKIEELNGLLSDFKAVGLNNKQIIKTLCEDYKFCFNNL